jgi:hypothetical protein
MAPRACGMCRGAVHKVIAGALDGQRWLMVSACLQNSLLFALLLHPGRRSRAWHRRRG